MTPEEINRRIAEWAGWTLQKGMGAIPDYWKSPTGETTHYHPDYSHTNAAMDLLVVLVEREYTYRLQDDLAGCGHVLIVWDKRTSELVANSDYLSTIPAAICTAIIELIEREGRL